LTAIVAITSLSFNMAIATRTRHAALSTRSVWWARARARALLAAGAAAATGATAKSADWRQRTPDAARKRGHVFCSHQDWRTTMSNTSLGKELLDLERDYWQAVKEKDGDAVMRLTDDECILTGAQGVRRLNKEALPELMQSTPYTLHSFELKDPEVHEVRDDVAILAYNVHEELTVDGKRVKLDAADASTWVRRDGRWLCALHTESITGDPFGRDRKS
jgi:uncharacterized protein (TIGR02246 family)